MDTLQSKSRWQEPGFHESDIIRIPSRIFPNHLSYETDRYNVRGLKIALDRVACYLGSEGGMGDPMKFFYFLYSGMSKYRAQLLSFMCTIVAFPVALHSASLLKRDDSTELCPINASSCLPVHGCATYWVLSTYE